MATPDPNDLSSRLNADSPTPPATPGFFDTLGFSASMSTPTAGAGLAARVGRTKIAAAIGATAVLISGAAYAGGLMGGGDGRDAAPLTPAHTSSAADTKDDDSSTVEKPRSLEPKSNDGNGAGKGSGGGTTSNPGTTADPDSDSAENGDKPWWANRPHCHGPHDHDWWGDHDGDADRHSLNWGDGRFSWGEHNGDWDGRGCGWGDHDGGWGDHDGDWGDHDGDWGDHDGDWGDHDGDWGDDGDRDGHGEGDGSHER